MTEDDTFAALNPVPFKIMFDKWLNYYLEKSQPDWIIKRRNGDKDTINEISAFFRSYGWSYHNFLDQGSS